MKKLIGLLFLALTLFVSPASAANCDSYPYTTLTNGTAANATTVMGNFTAILNCANNVLAHNGANSDITSLTALTTPLTTAQGGTGATGGQAAMNNLSGVYVICLSQVPHSYTGSTTETTLATCTIPANVMGTNGCLEVWSLWGMSGTAGTKTLLVRYAAASSITAPTVLNGAGGTTNMAYQHLDFICNVNSTGAQQAFPTIAAGFGTSTLSLTAWSVNTTSSSVLSFNVQLGASADTATLVGYMVKVDQSAGN